LRNTDPRFGLAVNVTVVPLMYGSEQSLPQLIPAGLDVIVPLPRPVLFTVSVKRSLNVAVTVRAARMVTAQEAPDDESQPLQPMNLDPAAATAVSVTDVPLMYGSEQSAPQLIPDGLAVTVPAPRSAFATASVYTSLNVAVTVRAAVIVTVHVFADAESHPDQPVNAEPDAAVAVRVTVVPLTYGSEQSAPQVIPAGFAVTLPEPRSAFVTVSV